MKVQGYVNCTADKISCYQEPPPTGPAPTTPPPWATPATHPVMLMLIRNTVAHFPLPRRPRFRILSDPVILIPVIAPHPLIEDRN